MKKVALSLLALALVGSMAFGQDAAAPALKIGGYLDVGTLTTIGADSGTSTIIKGDDSGIVGGSYEFRGAYGTDKAGLIFNVRFENLAAPLSGATVAATSPATGYVTTLSGTIYDVQSAYTWFKIPGAEIVKVLAGNYNNDGTAWNQLDDRGDKQTAGTGVAIQVTPAEGFTLGGGFNPAGKANAVWSGGASYTVPATVQVVAAAKTGLDKTGAIAVDQVAFSFKLLLDGPLSAKGGVNLLHLIPSTSGGKDYAFSTNVIDVTLGYNITDAFSAGLLTYVYTYGADVKNPLPTGDAAAISYSINPYVNYTVDPVTAVGLGGKYIVGATSVYDITKIDNTGANSGINNKVTQIEINPNATFTIDANTKIYVNYLYDTQSGDGKNNVDASWSTFKIDYRYTF